jgi:hypothetical protein
MPRQQLSRDGWRAGNYGEGFDEVEISIKAQKQFSLVCTHEVFCPIEMHGLLEKNKTRSLILLDGLSKLSNNRASLG